MNFGLQQYAWLFLLVPAAAFLGMYRTRVHQRRMTTLIDAALLDAVCENPERTRRRLRRSSIVLALTTFLLVAALLRPQWGFEWRESRHRGGDIVLAVDVSDSMLAADAPPSRLERAKHKIMDLLGMLRGDRAALVAFAGVAFVESPLTLDYGAFRQFLGMLAPDLIPVKGSNIEVALKKSLEALGIKEGAAPSTPRGAAIVLLTDGEELDGDLVSIGETAKANGVRIYVLGIGTPEGAPIPSANGGYKKDKSGKVVITRLRPDILEQIALATGGTYVQSISSSEDIKTIYNESMRQGLSETEQTMGSAKRRHEYYQLPLALALLLIVLLHWGRFARARTREAAAMLAFLFSLSAAPARAENSEALGAKAKADFEKGNFAAAEKTFNAAREQNAADPRFALGLGASKYRQGKFDEAQATFSEAASAATERKDKATALYNLGNSFVQAERYKEAISAYEQSLKLVPEDLEAQENLEYAKKKLEEQKQQENDKQEEQKKEQDQQQSSSASPQDSEDKQEQEQEQRQDQQGSSSSSSSGTSEEEQKQKEAEKQKEEQKEGGEQSSSESPDKPESQKKDEVLLDSVQEKQDARNRYRAQQAIKELKAEKRRMPEKDW